MTPSAEYPPPDAVACDRLFARCADRLLLYIRLRLGSGLRARTDSMDVLQEAFLHAHRHVDRFVPPETGHRDRAFLGWLCGIAENRIRDLADHHGAARRSSKREVRDVTQVLRELERSGHGPVTSVVRQEERDRLVHAVDQLSPIEREALVLRHFEGLTFDAIASRTGLSETSVRRAVGRATLRLGELLGDDR